MSNQRNRVKKFYTPLPLLRVHTKAAKRYQGSLPITHKLPANKSNKQSNHLSNLENLNEYSNDNDLNKDVNWEISKEEYFLDSVDWENNEIKYLYNN
ncbi:6923_t:CDS:2, partial [Dentiscutata erythropus]